MTAVRMRAELPGGVLHHPGGARTTRRRSARNHRLLAALTALLIAAALVLVPARRASAEPIADWLAWANGVRASNGLPGLVLDAQQSALAQQRADTNAANGGLAHTPSLRAGVTVNWTKLGENVGMGPSVSTIGTAFLNSPQHLHNLLDPAFTHIGIGVTMRGGTMYVTHRFLGLGAEPAPAPEPPPAPKPTTPPTTAPRPAPTAPPTTVAPPPPPPPAPPTPPPATPGRVAAVLDALHQLG